MSAPAHTLRIVVADDDPFTVSLVAGGLQARGFDVTSAASVSEALRMVAETDPHVLVSDLDFGDDASGLALLRRVAEERPWVGLVVLTAHRSPRLAVDDPDDLPAGAVYIVKSSLRGVDDLVAAVRGAIAGDGQPVPLPEPGEGLVAVTAAQAEVLRMLASGASTRALAEHRGTSTRAVETMLHHLYIALGLDLSDRSNPRVEAVRLWQQGRVTVR